MTDQEVYKPGDASKAAGDSLKNTLTTGWKSPSEVFGVTHDPSKILDELIDVSAIEGLTDSFEDFGKDVVSLGENLEDLVNPEAIEQNAQRIADTAAAANIKFLEDRFENIKRSWNTTTNITLGSILKDAAPGMKTMVSGKGKSMWTAIGEGITTTFKDYMDRLLEAFGDHMASDPDLVAAIAQLDSVQTFISGIKTISDVIDIIQQVIKVIEPMLPIIEMTTDLATVWCSGGASALSASNKAVKEGEFQAQAALYIILKVFKKYIFDITFTVPSILVKSAALLEVPDSFDMVSEMGDKQDEAWFDLFMGENSEFEEFYNSSKNKEIYKTAADQTQKDLKEMMEDPLKNVEKMTQEVISKLQSNTFTRNVMNEAMKQSNITSNAINISRSQFKSIYERYIPRGEIDEDINSIEDADISVAEQINRKILFDLIAGLRDKDIRDFSADTIE